MFKTDDIRVYQSITTIQMYCRSNYMAEELENGNVGCNKDCKLRGISVSYTHLKKLSSTKHTISKT